MRSVGLRMTALLMLSLLAAGANAALIRIDVDVGSNGLDPDGVLWTGPGPTPTSFGLSFTVDTLSYTSSYLRYGDSRYLGGIDQYRFSGVSVLAAVVTADGAELPLDVTGLTGEFGGDVMFPDWCFCYGPFLSYDAVVPLQLGDDPLAAILLAQSGYYGQAGAGGDWGYFIGTGPMHMSVVPVPPAVWLFGSALGLMGVLRRKTNG